jgi:hypothetical protein
MKRLFIALTLVALMRVSLAEDVALYIIPPTSGATPTGYKLFVGTSPGSYGAPIDIGKELEYTIRDLSPGTYYFAATAYNADQESKYSNELKKEIWIRSPTSLRIVISGI